MLQSHDSNPDDRLELSTGNLMNKGQWLDDLLDEMGWTPADLSRATGLDSAVVSNIKNGKREIGLDTAIAIGKATNKKPETILRMAGKLPDIPIDKWADDMVYKLSKLPPNLREIAEGIIDSLGKKEEAAARKPRPKPKSSTR